MIVRGALFCPASFWGLLIRGVHLEERGFLVLSISQALSPRSALQGKESKMKVLSRATRQTNLQAPLCAVPLHADMLQEPLDIAYHSP